jgi:two-component system, NtrC family, response regulator
MNEPANKPTARVIMVEDDEIARLTLEEQLRDGGYEVHSFETAEPALALLKRQGADVVVSDMRLPTMDGITFLEQAKGADPQLIMLLLTGYGTVQDAVQAMKLGASDYLCKPVSADEILLRMERALAYRQARRDRDRLQHEVEKLFSYHNVIGHSQAMQKIFSVVEAIKDIDSTVLIEGETGTGKDVLARAVHFTSVRRAEPFVAANCMVLSRDLLESELFGHERGAFTGALHDKPGRFELAGRGTLLLDDVDDIPLDLQGKLVDVLERRKFERVGGSKSIPLNCRVVCATKKSLAELVAAGKFRDDLYYRMNVVRIHIPPLRERKDDIPYLAEHFLGLYRQRLDRNVRAIAPAAMQVLLACDWPGNVRELEHAIEVSLALCHGEELGAEDLPAGLRGESPGVSYTLHLPTAGKIDLPHLLRDVEAKAIDLAMTLSKGQQAGAAELLTIPRTTLQARLQKFRTE